MLTLPAPAKLNLFLHIIGRRADGYHELQSVMQFIDFCDELSFDLTSDHHIIVQTNYDEVPMENNLVYRAARALQEKCHVSRGALITLTKNLPVGAGLGGGSSDAATTLWGLNQLWGLDLNVDELALIGVQLGADVPFFVRGFAAWVEGIGEQLTPMTLPEPWYLLAIPGCMVSTAHLFSSPQLTRDCSPLTIGGYVFGNGRNVFADIVYHDYPPVKEAVAWLSAFSEVRMTGTGCVVFAIFDTAHEAGTIAALAPVGLRCVIARGLNRSPLFS